MYCPSGSPGSPQQQARLDYSSLPFASTQSPPAAWHQLDGSYVTALQHFRLHVLMQCQVTIFFGYGRQHTSDYTSLFGWSYDINASCYNFQELKICRCMFLTLAHIWEKHYHVSTVFYWRKKKRKCDGSVLFHLQMHSGWTCLFVQLVWMDWSGVEWSVTLMM